MPVNSHYQKEDLIDNKHRYQMLKLVCDKNEKFEVSKLELEADRQLYTIETLRKMQEQYPEYEIAFIMGSDNLKELETWNCANELVKEFKMYLLERDKDDVENIIQDSKFLEENKTAFIKAKNNVTSNMSSTFVREKLRGGKSIRYLTPDEVRSYIIKNNLYQ